VQLLALQHGKRGRTEEAIPVELLLAFTRALILEGMSTDKVSLALYAAQKATGAPDEVIEKFKKAILQEIETYSPWPKGFF
jgi:hypothetical protein